MDYVLIISAVSALHGAVIMLVVCLGARGGMERNQNVGIRIWSTMSSHRAWVAGHGAAVPWCWAVVLGRRRALGGVPARLRGAPPGRRAAGRCCDPDCARCRDRLRGAGPAAGAWACDRAAKRVLVQEHLEEEHGAGADRRWPR